MTTELALVDGSSETLDPETFGPFGVRGPDKVAQRFLYALTTPSGSVPGRPNDGTNFLEMLASFASEFDLYAAFSSCEPRASAAVRSWEAPDDPDSGRLGGARLATSEFVNGRLTLIFDIVSRDRTRPTQTIDYVLDS